MKKKKGNKWLVWVLLAVVVLLIVGVAIKNRQKPKGLEVETSKVEKRTIRETVSASGKVFPEKEVKISSDVSGEIVQLMVEEGDSIKSGQILARIDPDAYQSAVERGIASVNTSKSEIARSKSSVESAIAQVAQIEAQLENAKQIHQRNETLKNDGVISQQDFEASFANVRQLEANLKSSEASKRSAEQSVESSKYSMKSQEASLRELQTNLNRTTITSPTDGVISMLNVEQGERVVGTIQMTGTELMRIANFSSMEVQVEVSENDILRVSLLDSVEIEVDAYLDDKFLGVVTEIASSAANTGTSTSLTSDQVTNFVVKIRIITESYEHIVKNGRPIPFRPGMSAAVDINTNTKYDILTVPIQAVTTREKDEEEKKKSSEELGEDDIDEVVFVYEADTARMALVKTGIQDNEYIEVLDGLSEGEEIVSGPYSAVSRQVKSGKALSHKEKKDDKKGKGKDAEEE